MSIDQEVTLPPEAVFEVCFGKPLRSISPREVIGKILEKYDVVKSHQRFGLQQEVNSAYGLSSDVDWDKYWKTDKSIRSDLEHTLTAAEPFVREDLGFIWTHATTLTHLSASPGLVNPYISRRIGITREQVHILQGNITLQG